METNKTWKTYNWNYIHINRRVARIWKRGGCFERVRKVQTTLTRIFIVLESASHGLSENWDEICRKVQKFKRFFRPKSGGLQKKKKNGLHRNWDWFFGRNQKFKRFFRPKSGGLQKRKTKNWDWFFGRNQKFKRFFRPKSGGLQKRKQKKIGTDFSAKIWNSKVSSAQNQVVSRKKKKKERSLPKLGLIFRPKSEIQTFFPPKIRWSPKKKKKNWDWFFGQIRIFKRLRGVVFLWGGGAIFNFSQKIGLKSTKNVRFCIFHKPMEGARAPRPPPPPPGYATAY